MLAGLEPYAPDELWLTNQMRPTLPAARRDPSTTAAQHPHGQRPSLHRRATDTIIALAHTTADDAIENARRLQRNLTDGSLDGQPWNERFESWTITTDGLLTLAVISEGNHPPPGLPELDQLWRSIPP